MAERLELLRSLPPEGIERLAGGLVAGGLLGDAITTLLAFTPAVSDVVMVVNMLQALTVAKRSVISIPRVLSFQFTDHRYTQLHVTLQLHLHNKMNCSYYHKYDLRSIFKTHLSGSLMFT